MESKANLGDEEYSLSFRNKLARMLWSIVWHFLFRTSFKPTHIWRCWLLKIFGANIGKGVHVYPSCRIWAPWNLVMGANSSLGDFVNCYNVAMIKLEERAVVSQYSFLCTADKNYEDRTLIAKPINIGSRAWVCADVFIGPGVNVGENSVVGARATVFRDVEPWTIVGGNPAKILKVRKKVVKV